MVHTITKAFSYLTLLGQIFFVLAIVYWMFRAKVEKEAIINLLKEYGIILAFIVSLIATGGSLYYSEIAHWIPCKLCWLQRICMYPQVLLLGIAWWKNDYNIKKYSIPLAVIGFGFALYHSYLQQFPSANDAFCSVNGLGGCSTRAIYEFGYITMPLMSLTAFILIIMSIYFWQRARVESSIS
jgi:disulfide bond formation protein DsbB